MITAFIAGALIGGYSVHSVYAAMVRKIRSVVKGKCDHV